MIPRRFAFGVDQAGAESVLHPGRADTWWSARPLVWSDPSGLWVCDHDGVVLCPGLTPDDVVSDGQAVVVRAGRRSLRIVEGRVELGGPARRLGLEVEVAHAGSWTLRGGARPLPTSLDTTDIWPFPLGNGAAWWAGGAVIRTGAHGPRAAIVARPDGWALGPWGAVLTGDACTWRSGAAPGGPPVRWEQPLARTAWGTRVDADGGRACGLDLEGRPTAVDLRTGAASALPGLPVAGGWLAGDRLIATGGASILHGVREASWARRGGLLAGPGGVVWDLRTARPRFATPVIELGGTAFYNDERLLSVDWETGIGGVLCTETGATLASVRVPLEDDDAIATAWSGGGAVCVSTEAGATFCVSPAGEVVRARLEAPPALEADSGWTGPIEVEAGATFGDRRFGWRTDGLLAVQPA